MKKSALGDNPLSRGIFSKTENKPTATEKPDKDSRIHKQETTEKNKESIFLKISDRENVNFRLPVELNDWLNDLLRKGKRKHGRKIPKEVWVQAALELFQKMPVDWLEIESEEQLLETLISLESIIKKKETA